MEQIQKILIWRIFTKTQSSFDTLREVVFIDITTGDKITPREITYSLPSLFINETIEVWTYNLETVLAEKLETIISRGVASSQISIKKSGRLVSSDWILKRAKNKTHLQK